MTRIDIRSFGRLFDSVTNIGRRPTVYEDFATTIETYVLDFNANVYGERVRLFFLERLREERKFPSVMALTEQIGRDIEATREHFAAADGATAAGMTRRGRTSGRAPVF